jgi:hypothetical protein
LGSLVLDSAPSGLSSDRSSGLSRSNRVLRYAQHAAVQQPVAGEVEGIDFDFGILIDVNETDVAIRHHSFDVEMTIGWYYDEQSLGSRDHAADRMYTRLDALAIVNSDGANHSGFEGLDDLGAAAGNDLSGCRSQDIDVSKGQDRIVIMHPDGMAVVPEFLNLFCQFTVLSRTLSTPGEAIDPVRAQLKQLGASRMPPPRLSQPSN